MHIILRVCAVALVLTLAYSVTLGFSGGVVISSVLTSAALILVISGMQRVLRPQRIVILTWLFWGLSYLSNLIEAVYFGVLPFATAEKSAVGGLAISLLVALVTDLLSASKWEEPSHSCEIAPGLWWRIPLSAFLFFTIYLTAGIAIHPLIASFYQNRPLPSLGKLLSMQCCRGVLDIICILLVFMNWASSRRYAAWASACVFTVLCAWGPLLLPNAFLPPTIRLAHSIEMGASGVVFGMVVALLLLRPSSTTTGKPSKVEVNQLLA